MSEDSGKKKKGDEELHDEKMEQVNPVSGMYENWFLEYASYVILDRAVPYIIDGLKPVQRRILHAMKEMDDGRYNKVANIIGQTMQYHPHGDAAIGDALVKLGQKDLLIDTQGNWGNILTGDSSAAPRYIEARLSKFALEVAFNPKTTNWQLSYDGRKNEPINLPMKFPLVLAQGVEGIAVGLSTRILPHNFCELLKASIDFLKGRSFKLYPDFPTGGMIDVSQYNNGERGGRVRVRARIHIEDKKTLKITEVPYGVTTLSLIESILKANDKGKLKVKHIDDNTARDVEIVVHLPNGVSPDVTMDALYAFSDCEVSISPNACVIIEDHPVFTNVRDLLKQCTDNTVALLKRELEIKLAELEEKWQQSSLEKIFIENRIYRDIEECETWEAVIETIDKGLDPFKKLLRREVTRDDIVRLTEIKIKRISKYDSFKADELIKSIEEDIEQTKHYLANLIEFAVDYFKNLLDKYGEGRERKTEIKAFDVIDRTQVAVANTKLYMNVADGFIGTSLKKDEFVCECSDIDDIIVFRKDGTMQVTKVADKTFVGKGILYAGVFNKSDDRMVYHMMYQDGKDKRAYAKRFQVTSITRDREYNLTKGKKPGQVVYFTANPNGESEVVTVYLKHRPRIRLQFDFDFGELAIKGRSAGGNTVSKYEIRKVVQKSQGVSTLGGREIWYDEALSRLNSDGNGRFLGEFSGEDRILVIYQDGTYELTSYDLANRYDGRGKIIELIKLEGDTVISAIHYEGKNDAYYVKRFEVETTSIDTRYSFISDSEGSKLIFATTKKNPEVEIKYSSRKKDDQNEQLEEFIDVKGWKAIGNKLTSDKISKVELISHDEPEPKTTETKEEDKEDSSGGKPSSKKSAEDIPFDVIDTRDKDNPNPTLFDQD